MHLKEQTINITYMFVSWTIMTAELTLQAVRGNCIQLHSVYIMTNIAASFVSMATLLNLVRS
jgi:hypothetical protein